MIPIKNNPHIRKMFLTLAFFLFAFPLFAQIAVGTYTGNATDNRNITGIGFNPTAVIIKGNSIFTPDAQIRTGTMAGDITKEMTTTGSSLANCIQSLIADGFQVGTNGRVNGSGLIYYYIAFRNMTGYIAGGSYVGDGNPTYTWSTLTFQPEVVIVVPEASNTAFWKSASMPAADSKSFVNGLGFPLSPSITSLTSNGFTVGTNLNVSGTTYHFIAFNEDNTCAVSGNYAMSQGAYTGNSTNCSTPITGLCGSPVWLVIGGGGSGGCGVSCGEEQCTNSHRTPMLSATNCSAANKHTFNLAANSATDIYEVTTSVTIDGSGSVNCSGVPYYWMTFNGTNNNLPVELLSFSGECQSEKVILHWQTASEQNNSHFTIERSLAPSPSGEGWGEAGTVKGAGNSSTIRNYEFVDLTPYSPLPMGEGQVRKDSFGGVRYYRLKQTDYDGRYEYFGPISVICEPTDEWDLILQNIPATDELLGTLLLPEDVNVKVEIIDLAGKTILLPFGNDGMGFSKGSNLLQFDLKDIAQGVYFIKTYNNKKQLMKKFIKQ